MCKLHTRTDNTHRWSCRLNALPHIVQTYFRSSLCVSLCFVSADALLNTLPHTCKYTNVYTLSFGKKYIKYIQKYMPYIRNLPTRHIWNDQFEFPTLTFNYHRRRVLSYKKVRRGESAETTRRERILRQRAGLAELFPPLSLSLCALAQLSTRLASSGFGIYRAYFRGDDLFFLWVREGRREEKVFFFPLTAKRRNC